MVFRAVTVADSRRVACSMRPTLVFETGARTRYYLPPEDVRTDLLVQSSTLTRCQYKGLGSYWSLRIGERVLPDLVSTYLDPSPEAAKIAGLLCFRHEDRRLQFAVDGEVIGATR